MADSFESETGTGRDHQRATASERTRLGGSSALLATVALVGLTDGRPFVAIAGGVAILVSWSLLGPTEAFAFGHVALAAVVPADALAGRTIPVELVVIEIGLVGMLVASAVARGASGVGLVGDSGGRDSGHSVKRAAVEIGLVLAWTLAGGAVAVAVTRSALDLWIAGVSVVVVSALTAYGLHRSQLVSLGLVGDDDE